jgi:hypothetical protein
VDCIQQLQWYGLPIQITSLATNHLDIKRTLKDSSEDEDKDESDGEDGSYFDLKPEHVGAGGVSANALY